MYHCNIEVTFPGGLELFVSCGLSTFKNNFFPPVIDRARSGVQDDNLTSVMFILVIDQLETGINI